MEYKKGIAYGVGIGPGDPELITLKACRLIRENKVIVFPGKVPQETTAYRIAAAAVQELAGKELLAIDMPMVKDRALIEESHRKAADTIEKYLDEGMNVVYLTLGDVTIYCSFSYIQHILEAEGYEVELVPGVTSFCAAAARLGISLAEGKDRLHILPALHTTVPADLEQPDNYVLMKSGSRMNEVKALLKNTDLEVKAVENCGMENEELYTSLSEIPDDAGYFTIMIAK